MMTAVKTAVKRRCSDITKQISDEVARVAVRIKEET